MASTQVEAPAPTHQHTPFFKLFIGIKQRFKGCWCFMHRTSADNEEVQVQRQFLSLLDQDITNHPEQLKPIDADLVRRMRSLVGHIKVDIDAPLSKE